MEKLDLTKILKDCPKGTKLYSPLFGEVKFVKIDVNAIHSIKVQHHHSLQDSFTKDGRFYVYQDAECMLFPSRENRDWSTFQAPKPKPKFEPFQKVLARNTEDEYWQAHFYSHFDEPYNLHVCISSEYEFRYCIPYEGNESLLATAIEPKE